MDSNGTIERVQKNNKKHREEEIIRFNLKSIFLDVFIVLILLAISFYYSKNASDDIKYYFPFGLVIVMGGLLFEYRKIAKLENLLITLFGALLLSFFIVLYFSTDSSDPKGALYFWPQLYIFSFSIIALYYLKKEITPKLTEGITLLQSLAIIYWIVDIGNIMDSIIIYFAIAIGLIFSIFSMYNAFSYRILTKSTRLSLSIWSSIIMLIFGFEFVINIFKYYQINTSNDTNEIIIFTFQNFIFGISIIYIIQNFILLFDYLFEERSKIMYNSQDEIQRVHINRFSEEQIKIKHAIIVFIAISIYFFLNYQFQFIPRNMAIWSTFIFVPYILNFFISIKQRKKK